MKTTTKPRKLKDMNDGKLTQEQFLTRMEEEYMKNVAISRAKNSDYAGSEDPFKNFRLIESLSGGRISAADGILVRLTDKLQRVANLLAVPNMEGKVKDEKIGDTLADTANYSIILKLLLEEDANQQNHA